ncbi:MAG: VCBS repeat-containing protein [Phycisphaerales bacterium]|nr:VCBS repeat-containing protein [Phycisphaerales bacterium]
MYALRTAITSFVLIVSFTSFAPTIADNCLPYPYYPPTIQVGAGEVVGRYLDIDNDGITDILSRSGIFAYTLDNQGGLTRTRILDTSLYVQESFPGYFSYDHSLDILSVAKSGDYDYFLLYFRSDSPDERLLDDILYLGDKEHVGGVAAELPQAPLTSSTGQALYLINDAGTCTIHLCLVRNTGIQELSQTTQLDFEANSPILVDLDNNGVSDLLMRNVDGAIVTILRSGPLVPSEIDATFYVDSYTRPLFIDYDGDQIPELTFACGEFVRIFKRDDSGYFEWRTYEHSRELKFVGQGDVDDDGDIDILIDDDSYAFGIGESGHVRILRQTDIGAFVAGSAMQTGGYLSGAAVIDLNADGHSDIVAFNGAGATLHFADGQGGYPHPHALELNTNEIESPGALTAIDANHDGLDDILVSQDTQGTFLVSNVGGGEFSSPVTQTAYGPRVVRLADMDEDGIDDAVCVTEFSASSGPAIGYGNSDGSLGPFESHSLGQTSGVTDLDVGDINGDGHLDIACTRFGDDRLTILLGNGDRSFQPPVSFNTPDGPANVRVADFNNDGLDDVVTGNYRDGSFSVFLASAPELLDYHYGTWTRFGGGVSADIEVADFDQDGFVDLLMPSWSSGPELRWGNGGAYFTFHDELDASAGTDSLHLVDLNRDGLTDIVCYHDGGKTISAYLNLGNRAFADPVLFAVPRTVRGLCIGDFDGLGDLDFAINDGNGIYLYFADTCELESAVPGDTNADGLLTPDDVPGFVAILLDLGGSPGARKAADMNQDGVNDAMDIALFVTCLLNGGC